MDDAAKMYELQKVDMTWIKVGKRLQQLQKMLGESAELRTARGQVTQTEGSLHDWRAKQQNAELEAKSLVARIHETEQRLMGGTVRNPKELEALQASLEALRRQQAQVDDQAMEAMVQTDQLVSQLAGEQQTLDSVEQQWRGSQGELRGEETKLKQNYVLLKRKREQLATAMSEPLRKRYEDMRKRKAGVAVAVVQNGICSACNVKIPTGVVNGLRNNNGTLTVCPSCGRYLYGG